MTFLWMLGRKVRKDFRGAKENNDLNDTCVKHINKNIVFGLIVHLIIAILFIGLAIQAKTDSTGFVEYLATSLFFFICSYIIFLLNLRYEKVSLICHSHGDIYQGNAIDFSRGTFGTGYVVCEFFVNGKRIRSKCLASSTMETNYKKGQELLVLYVSAGSYKWVIEYSSIPLLTLSNKRKKYLLQILKEEKS